MSKSLKLFTDIKYDGDNSPPCVYLVLAQAVTAVKPLCLKQNDLSLTVSSSVIVRLFVQLLFQWDGGDTCCGCKQQQKEKKTADVNHTVVIHSPAAMHLSRSWVRRGSGAQTAD